MAGERIAKLIAIGIMLALSIWELAFSMPAVLQQDDWARAYLCAHNEPSYCKRMLPWYPRGGAPADG